MATRFTYGSTHTFHVNEAYDSNPDVDQIGSIDGDSAGVTAIDDDDCFRTESANKDAIDDGERRSEIKRLSVGDLAPHIDHYRNMISLKRQGSSYGSRPSLAELHLQIDHLPRKQLPNASLTTTPEIVEANKKTLKQTKRVKFGWITGVLVRCILNILGAMLYLRLSWMAGQAGVALATLVVLLSYLVTTLTAISMCAITTNGEIQGGGAYYLLSRSLGPEFGGSMGVMFAIANSFAVSLHTVGLAETVRDVMKEHGVVIIDGAKNDIRLIGGIVLILLLLIVIIGLDFETKTQLVLLFILIVSYFNYIIGTFLSVPEWKQARGITGYSWKTFTENIPPSWRGEHFFSLFAIYFPSATGIMAGANISGDLRDPSRAIPKGTLLAVLTTMLMYLAAMWTSAASCVRDASGDLFDLWNGTVSECAGNNTCQYGLMNHFQVMEMQSAYGPLVTAGIFASTLSSALVCLVSGPKLLQAVGRDRLFPTLEYLAKGYGNNDEPRLAYLACFFMSFAMTCIGDLNAIAPFISNFYLATYALVNYACFDSSLAKTPGWRPGFRYYNKWLSLLGAVLCVAAMFLMSWWAALLTFFFVLCLYVYLLRSKPEVNWGSSTQAHTYKSALHGMLKLLVTEDHVKNYRPQILVLSGNPVARAALVDFARNITAYKSLLVLGHIIVSQPTAGVYACLKNWTTAVYAWLGRRAVKSFYIPVAACNLKEGFRALIQATGLGKMRPNIVALGFKSNWRQSSVEEIDQYFQLIHESFDYDMALMILRVKGGLDYLAAMQEQHVYDAEYFTSPEISTPAVSVERCPSERVSSPITMIERNLNVAEHENRMPFASRDRKNTRKKRASVYTLGTETVKALAASMENFDLSLINTSQSQREVLASVNQFQIKVKKGVVDVWWLCDDGGLTLLIPYILTHQKSFVCGSKLRIFIGASGKNTIDQEQKSITALLQKFRIDFSDVIVLPDLNIMPKLSTINDFAEMIKPFVIETEKTDNSDRGSNIYITEAEMEVMKERTYRHLRVHELLMTYSKNSSLTVVSLPIPRRAGVSACLYLAWLEMLVKDISPVLLVRGNQRSVLTFYS